jgi:hypothetical protein
MVNFGLKTTGTDLKIYLKLCIYTEGVNLTKVHYMHIWKYHNEYNYNYTINIKKNIVRTLVNDTIYPHYNNKIFLKDKKRNCSEKINKNHASYFFVLNRHVKSTANFMEREKW